MKKFVTVLAAILMAAGCNKGADQQEITETREVTAPKEAAAAPAASSAERFGLQQMPAAAPAGGYTYATPEGWKEQPATQFRLANFKAGANGEVEVYLSKAGGGVPNNINRWRSQMGLAPLTEPELAALPRKTVLGQDAAFVNWEGVFGGMQSGEKKEGYRLAGVILEKGGEGVFVKMVGPAAAVDSELARLDEFVGSLKEDSSAGMAAANPHAGAMGGDPHAGMTPEQIAAMQQMNSGMAPMTPQVDWKAPEGWEKAPDRPMRSVTFKSADGVETYVSVLSGMAGGAAANVNRWRNQIGLDEPFSAEQIAALPKTEVLGQQCPVVELSGTFRAMAGTPQPNSMLLGTVCETPGQTLFVKMTGPEAAVKANKDKFLAFSQSLTMKAPPAEETSAGTAEPPAAAVPDPSAGTAEPPAAAAPETSAGTAEPQPQPQPQQQ